MLGTALLSFSLQSALAVAPPSPDGIRESVSFYASFDERIAGDFGGRSLKPRIRHDHETTKGRYVYSDGIPADAFRIVEGGIHGGSLEATAVPPRRGRLFFPAKGNLPFNASGWSGSVSFWLQCNPDTMLKTRFCDPVQITERRAGDGGLWIDFPDSKPRDLRLGAFRALEPGEKSVKESDPQAPLIRVRRIGFQENEWHHLAMTWRNLDTGRADAHVTLFIDGKRIGALADRDIAMKWNLDRTGIYFAVGLIGRLDELAVFKRELTADEIGLLHRNPGLLGSLAAKK